MVTDDADDAAGIRGQRKEIRERQIDLDRVEGKE